MDLKRITAALVKDLAPLRFGAPVTHVYNPLEYAAASYGQYLQRYGQGSRKVVMFGMNPGPWGMAQTGVPFGDVAIVKDWLGIEAPVGKPADEHPKRPVQGFACPRSEVSGSRIWGWARDRFRTPQRFFKKFFIANYCPLVFMEDTGRNRTPDKLPVAETKPLMEACDRALLRTIEHFQPDMVIGVGKFAEDRARSALADLDVKIGRILHPSPASPAANRGWADAATAQLESYGLLAN
jgi:single-strand selective monofunctional uracil DNA glycosylase